VRLPPVGDLLIANYFAMFALPFSLALALSSLTPLSLMSLTKLLLLFVSSNAFMISSVSLRLGLSSLQREEALYFSIPF
jgi:hypothetical protein